MGQLLGLGPVAQLGLEGRGAAGARGLVQVLPELGAQAGVLPRPLAALGPIARRRGGEPDYGGADRTPGRVLALFLEHLAGGDQAPADVARLPVVRGANT